MAWEPWNIQTDGPPCLGCFYWKPMFKYIRIRPGVESPDGIRCCHVESMYHDFSCFKDKHARPSAQVTD